jgi:hypothetical protein
MDKNRKIWTIKGANLKYYFKFAPLILLYVS